MTKRCEELKNKLRNDLQRELKEISGGADGAAGNKKPGRVVDTMDYFELVYECIDARINFLNVVSLNARSPVEPDIDLAIIHALLNGKKKTEELILKFFYFCLQLLQVVIQVKQVVIENVNNFIWHWNGIV